MLKGVKAFLLVLDFLLYVQKCRWFDSLAHRERNRQAKSKFWKCLVFTLCFRKAMSRQQGSWRCKAVQFGCHYHPASLKFVTFLKLQPLVCLKFQQGIGRNKTNNIASLCIRFCNYETSAAHYLWQKISSTIDVRGLTFTKYMPGHQGSNLQTSPPIEEQSCFTKHKNVNNLIR